jgi:hypothetical protein
MDAEAPRDPRVDAAIRVAEKFEVDPESDHVTPSVWKLLAAEVRRLRAENERLREMLGAITRLREPVAAEIARAALAGEEGEK